MCLLTVFPGGCPITDLHAERLENGCDRNGDGFGWALATPEAILTGHGLSADDVIAQFRRVRVQHPDAPALFHSRMATAGTVTVDNVHPFAVPGEDTVMAHNGVLPEFFQPDKGDLRSDTRIMAEDWLPGAWATAERDWRLNGRALDAPAWRRRFRGLLGTDKVAFLTVDPRYRKQLYIVNAERGHWLDGAWWSNSSYEPYVYYPGSWRSGPKPGDAGYKPYTPYYFQGRPEWDDITAAGEWVNHQGVVWIHNDRGIWCQVEEERRMPTPDLPARCSTCQTRGSVDPTSLICVWCNCCDACGEWIEAGDKCYVCAAVTVGPKALAATPHVGSVEDMSEEQWEEYLRARWGGAERYAD